MKRTKTAELEAKYAGPGDFVEGQGIQGSMID